MISTPRSDEESFVCDKGTVVSIYFAETLERELAAVTAERDALQARVDTLMLEFCPDEMTAEQVLRWEMSQTRSAK